MYNIIVVDDEKGSRDILVELIENSSSDYKVVAVFQDGIDTWEYLEKNFDVDIVITDIKMPSMSGLELSKRIFESNLNIKIIIVSGYGEFEYAKKAIEYNVQNYLLKPINVKELISTLSDIKKTFDKNKLESQLHSANEKIEEFFSDLCCGINNSSEDILLRFEKLNLPINIDTSSGYIIETQFVYENFVWKYGVNKLMLAINNTIYITLKCLSYPLLSRSNSFIFICLYSGNLEAEALQSTISEMLKIDFKLKIIQHFDSILNITNNFYTIEEQTELLLSHLLIGDINIRKDFYNTVISKIDFSDKYNSLVKHLESTPVATLLQNFRFGDSINYLNNDSQTSELNDTIISGANKYISENYQNDITRDDVAHSVYMNPSYFSRYFKLQTGQSFTDYLTTYRMKIAVKILEDNPNIRIEEMCYLVGYNSRKTFTKNFKIHTMHTPSSYKKNVLKVDDEYEK